MLKRAITVACTTFVVVSACIESRFTCEDDDQCEAGGVAGTCEPTGACSFPDDACPSGRRYGDHGRSDLAGMCVDADATDTGSSTTASTTVASTVATTLETSLETSLDAESSVGPSTSSESSASSEGPAVCPPGWWDCAWTRRVELSTDTPLPMAPESVPVLVRLDPTRFDFDAARDDGADLRFVQDGIVLAHELEAWNEGESAIAWLALPARGGAVVLYHGNLDAPAIDDADAVWSAPFAAVWHFTGGYDDSSGNANDGVATDGVLESAGLIGNAADLGAVDHRIDVPPSASLEDVLFGGGTLSAWIRLRTFGGTNRGRIADNTANGDGGWMFYPANDTGGEVRVRQGYAGGQVIWRSPAQTIAVEQWYHVAATFDALVDELPRLYIDGVEQEVALSQGMIVGDAVTDAGNGLVIGNSDVADRWYDGLIDELRIERVARSPEWIAVQAQSMRDELLSYGAIEQLEDQ